MHITLLIGVTKIIYTVVTFHWFFIDFGNCYVFESVDQTLNGLKEIHEKSYLLVPASSLGIFWEISTINPHLEYAIRKIKEDILKTQIQSRFQNPVKYPRRNFFFFFLTLRAVTYFHKKLHLTSQKSTILHVWMGSEYASKINPSLITVIIILIIVSIIQKQPSIGVLKKSYFENMQQVYSGTPMPKCNFNMVAKQLYWNHTSACVSPANLLHIFGTPFPKNTYGRLLLIIL